jgi:hypothetical protein
MKTAARYLLLSALLVLVAGCSTRNREGRTEQEHTPLVVYNQSFNDMRVYVVAGGPRVRLGMASANTTTRLRIPGHVVGLGRDVQFVVDPMASAAVGRSFNMFVRPGQEVTITIPPYLR